MIVDTIAIIIFIIAALVILEGNRKERLFALKAVAVTYIVTMIYWFIKF